MPEQIIYGILNKKNINDIIIGMNKMVLIKNKKKFNKILLDVLYNNNSFDELFLQILPNEKFTIKGTKITSGSYGKIFNGSGCENPCIVKKCTSIRFKKSFIEECITGIILNLLHTEMEKKINRKFRLPFPEIYALSKDNKSLPMIFVEKLDYTLFHYYIEITKKDTKKEFIMLYKICFMLDCLQKAINFTHRDFHINNIMVKYYKKNDQEFYDPYIIDIGSCCCELYFGRKYIINDEIYNNNFNCFKKDTDMRLMISNLYENKSYISDVFYNFIKKMFTEKELSYLNEGKVVHYYSDVYENTNFYPENIMKKIDNENLCS